MVATAAAEKIYTAAEYFEADERSEERIEYYYGKEYTEQFPTLQYYLIIDQYEPSAVCYTRKGTDWMYAAFHDPDAEIPLEYFNTRLSLRKIYKKVKFEA
jgi:hypothetical protein